MLSVRRSGDPFTAALRWRVVRHVLVGVALAGLLAALGAVVRLLPLALDPALPTAAFAPFARSLFALALEVALLLGVSGGAATALFALGDRGEGRALAALGEPPWRTLLRAAPAIAPFLVALAAVSFTFGRDAGAPGQVLEEIVRGGEARCLRVTYAPRAAATTVVLPFVPLVWLCAPGHVPRLAGRTPVGGLPLSARDLHFSGDLRELTLDDARLAFPLPAQEPLRMHAGVFALRGMAPWGRALVLPAGARAALLPFVAFVGLVLVGRRLLLRPLDGPYGRVVALVTGLLPPLASFAALQALERTAAGSGIFLVVVPAVALAASAIPWDALGRRIAARVDGSRVAPPRKR